MTICCNKKTTTKTNGIKYLDECVRLIIEYLRKTLIYLNFFLMYTHTYLLIYIPVYI